VLIEMLQGKLHFGTVTATRFDYPGSLTVDRDLIDQAGMRVHQKVQLINCNTGARLETYLIEGERGSAEIVVNGGAARHFQAGDRAIIIAYVFCDAAEADALSAKVVVLGQGNRVERVI